MQNATSDMSMTMTPWLHFGTSDYLIFQAWQPSSSGTIVGACIGLLSFCILERCLAAYRRAQESKWSARTVLTPSRSRSDSSNEDNVGVLRESNSTYRRQLIPPFVPSRDILRGVIQAIQSTFSYALMLAVMTFNGAYIIAIILGLGIGEVLFGRIGRRLDIQLVSNDALAEDTKT